MNHVISPLRLFTLATSALLAIGTTACSSDSESDTDSDDDCAVEVTYTDKDGNEEAGEKICKKLPSACTEDNVCLDEACDDALAALCEAGSTKNACGSVSFGGSFSVGVGCQRNP